MGIKHHKRTWIILFCVLLAIVLAFTLFYIAMPKMGYCFDVAFDDTGERLYVTAGYRGLHIFRLNQKESSNILRPITPAVIIVILRLWMIGLI